MNKIADALRLIRLTNQYKNPAVMSSFGKDSMAMLGLLREEGIKLPVIFYREPFFPEKYEFADKVIKDWDLEVFDYEPIRTAMIKKNGHMEVMNYYSFGELPLALPTGIIEPVDNQPYLCGLNDLLKKKTSVFDYPWDTVLIGHKSTDTCPLRGSLELHVEVKKTPNCPDGIFPLKNWTDDDVWNYLEDRGIPIHSDRYVNRTEKGDKTFNPDYFPTCTRCIDPDQPMSVHCPIAGKEIPNISLSVPYIEDEGFTYFGRTA